MKFTSPKLRIDAEATEYLIETSISKLKNEIDSFAILGSDEMNYIQALATENGFVVQFQNGSIEEHYEFDTYLSRPQAVQLFQAYLQGTKNWQGNLSYSKVKIMGIVGKIGFTMGSFFGGLVRDTLLIGDIHKLVMTGTGIVPSNDFALQRKDEIRIAIEPIGTLVNTGK